MRTTLEPPKQASAGRHPEARKSGISPRWLTTAAFWALGLFVALNMIFATVGNRDKKTHLGSANDSIQDLWSSTGSIDLAINGLAALKQPPTVVLLGSSLMMHPFWAMDIEADPKTPDIFHYHGSKTLEKALAENGCPEEHVYSLAIFGQMVSDAYIYVNDFLKGDRKPQVLVYGIAPRDFSDSDLPAPMATFTFKRLVGLDNLYRYANDYLPGWQDKADFVASHACFLYGKRWRLQHEVEKAVDKGYKTLGLASSESDILKKPKANTAGFMLTGSNAERWSTSEREYTRRYRDIENKNLSVQIGFLRNIIKDCKERDIRLVLVNMPLTKKNRSLLPPGFYDKFRSTIKEIAAKPGVDFVDLGPSPLFKDVDYWDTAHLSHIGGHKLVALIAPHIARALNEARGGESVQSQMATKDAVVTH